MAIRLERQQFGDAERLLQEAVAFSAGLFADGGVDQVAGHENEERAGGGARRRVSPS